MSTPTTCRRHEEGIAASFAGAVTDPLFLALVDNPRQSYAWDTTTAGPCPGFNAIVPAFGAVQFDASGDSDASAEVVGPSGAAFTTELEVTTISLADVATQASPTELVITGHSPIAILATDPDGRRLGLDPSSLQFIDEISGGQYSRTPAAPQSLVIPMPVAGAYSIQVIGTGTGPYTIDVDTKDAQGVTLGHASFTGTATPGSNDTINTSLGPSGAVGNADTTPPVLTLPANMIAEATSAAGALVTFSATAKDAVDGSRAVTCLPASGSTFSLGSTVVACSASDLSGNTATGSFTITVRDTTPPVLTLPANLTLEATGPSGAVATFAASAVDVVDGVRPVSCTPSSGSSFPLGTTVVSCAASDLSGNKAASTFSVLVQDTTPPAITSVVSSDPSIWPPNHRMVQETIAVQDQDLVDPSPVCRITGVTSNESEPGAWQVTGDLTLSLLASRDGAGTGRIYTIVVTCTDRSGNASSRSTTVVVPHDMRRD